MGTASRKNFIFYFRYGRKGFPAFRGAASRAIGKGGDTSSGLHTLVENKSSFLFPSARVQKLHAFKNCTCSKIAQFMLLSATVY